MFITLVAAGLLLLALNKFYHYVASRQSFPYPPGPPGDFIIGNLRQMPLKYAWLAFDEWHRKYGPINYLNVAGKPIVVIHTHEAAVDLLDKRSVIYSERPRLVMARELAGLDQITALMPYGDVHKQHRKLLAQALHPRVVERDYAQIEERYASKLAKSLLNDSGDFVNHIERCMGEIIQSISYGEEDGDDFVELGRENMRHINGIARGYLVELLPWLKYVPSWFPGAQFHRDAKTTKEIAAKAQWLPYQAVKQKAETGIAPPSYVLSALDTMKTTEDIDDQMISMSALTLFSGGTDSTATTLLTFIMAMLLYPDVQSRAQEEIDRVIGDHLPSLASRDSLPYLNALLTETLRWHPAAPTGIAHSLKQDDIYNGCFIPAGTMIFVNVRGIFHDESHFPDPSTFNPDRFLDGNLTEKDANTSRPDPWDVAFGYGRRICPGISVAQTGVWIAMATILSCFDIRPKLDPKTMKPIIPEPQFSGGGISRPLPFVCDIIPRSQGHAERITEAVVQG
ncbi:hypothetical protein FRB95_012093 [Tulasnella sp. JGI-2019a]|nr:hypothetical protein FRB93_004129 [Tulasnella sp. JGI-2019a]KAG9035074.1 hypothetical protein FRB95_012093 [Tulasnella sp. JGI-2019a]